MSQTRWTERVDVVVIGTGVSGLVSAIVASSAGLKTLVLEKSGLWGGTTAISGGALWVPNNSLMLEAGVQDSAADAMRYMSDVVEDLGPSTSEARKQAFIENASKMAEFLAGKGFKWQRGVHYPDYYPTRPGARVGRMLEGKVFDGHKLGAWLKTLRTRENVPQLAISSDNAPHLALLTRTWGGFFTLVKILIKTGLWELAGRTPLIAGRCLVGQLMWLALKNGVEVRLNTTLDDLEIAGDRVAGVSVSSHGQRSRIAAARAVMLAAGGFAQNSAFRKRYQEVGNEFTSTVETDTGEVIRMAVNAGAATALMAEAWWMPAARIPDGITMPVVWERQLPHSIMVDKTGKRFMNEAKPYIDAGRDLLQRLNGGSAPAWLILDARHRSYYVFGPALAGRTPQRWIDEGFMVKADTLDNLAEKINVNPQNLGKTVAQFNRFADTGDDLDFGRGNNIYDNFYSDPRSKPNPNLGRIERPPFYAIPIVPGDLGTKGGLLTDENGRVLRTDGSVMQGLYAAGNTTASVTGRTYPGPGSTLGPAATFAYIAMRHASGLNE